MEYHFSMFGGNESCWLMAERVFMFETVCYLNYRDTISSFSIRHARGGESDGEIRITAAIYIPQTFCL